MELAHAQTLARARTCIAMLADQANNEDASSAYEHALIELDLLHDDQSPALDAGLGDLPGPDEREQLFDAASTTVAHLAEHDVDPLRLELILWALHDAHAQDHQ